MSLGTGCNWVTGFKTYNDAAKMYTPVADMTPVATRAPEGLSLIL